MPGRSWENQERPPEFYLRPAVKGHQIHPEVRAAFEQLWPWLWTYVRQQLGDPGRASDLAEEVACRVSKYVQTHNGKVRSLVGLCRVAAINFVTSTKTKESRIDYRGLGQDIEGELGPAAPDGQEDVELSIWADQILRGHNRDTRIMLQLRLLKYTWPEIGKILGLTAGQARLRFQRALEQTDDDVLPHRRERGGS